MDYVDSDFQDMKGFLDKTHKKWQKELRKKCCAGFVRDEKGFSGERIAVS